MSWLEYLEGNVLEQCKEVETFGEAVSLLQSNNARAAIVPMLKMPFEREPQYHISAVLPLQNRGFYLYTKGEVKNLSLLGVSHTVHYTHDFIPDYIRDFNKEVNLIKVEENEAAEYDFLISSRPGAGAVALSKQEFVPECGAGIYAMVCKKEDVDFRQKVKQYHDEAAADITNLQRRLMLAFKEYDLRGIIVEKDHSAHLHGVVAYVKEGLQYVSHSQSTSHEFVHFAMAKM